MRIDAPLIEPGVPLLVLLSGGADSCCLLHLAVERGARVSALHVNYGLRGEESEGDEQLCADLSARLGVPLTVERVALPAGGNLQAAARDARYAAAERIAAGYYAAAHTLSDQAETVLYRLGSSPGRRSLLGMEERHGRLIRPLLHVTRSDTRAYCRARGIAWREDSSNADPRFARSRIRAALDDRAEAAIAETARQLREETELIDSAVDGALTDELSALAAMPAALAREVLRRLAGGPIARGRIEELLALAGRGGTVSLDVGGGRRAVVEYGRVRFQSLAREEPPAAVALRVPGAATFGAWSVSAGASGDVALDAGAIGDSLLVRPWRRGDRMRPAGAGGSRTLADLFADRKLPRAERTSVPVLEAGDGAIAWVPGVAVGELFRARAGCASVALSARRSPRV